VDLYPSRHGWKLWYQVSVRLEIVEAILSFHRCISLGVASFIFLKVHHEICACTRIGQCLELSKGQSFESFQLPKYRQGICLVSGSAIAAWRVIVSRLPVDPCLFRPFEVLFAFLKLDGALLFFSALRHQAKRAMPIGVFDF